MSPKRTFRVFVALILAVTFLAPEGAFAAQPADHGISFSKIVNARDFGGYKTKDGHKVKSGVLLRSGELSYATSKDIHKLRDKYHLRYVIDFRYTTDHKYCPDKKIKGAKNINIPAKSNKHPSKKTPKKRYKKLKAKGAKNLRLSAVRSAKKVGRSYTYSLVMSSHSRKAYRKYFNYLLENEDGKGVLIHCVHGKDRTGVAAFMTLVALGVDENKAYKEYVLTNGYIKKMIPKASKRKKLGVRESDLRYAVGKAKKKYGSMDKFLEKAYGLDKTKIKKLRSIYLK